MKGAAREAASTTYVNTTAPSGAATSDVPTAYAPPNLTVLSDPSGQDRISALDGLRGIAIILVAIHTNGTLSGELSSFALKLFVSLANIGWIGVELFFALSGFLITRILLGAKGEPHYFGRFYMRRVLRIFPLYYVALALVIFVAPHVSGLEVLARRGPRSSLWYWSYLANWAFPFGGLVGSLAHFWSLAVEEQFYLVWPAIVLLLRERSLVVVCAVLGGVALAFRVALFSVYPPITAGSAAYNFTIARCDALALGALVAVVVRHPAAFAVMKQWAGRTVTAILVLLAAMYVKQRGFNALDFPIATVGQTLLAILSAALVLLCVAPTETPSALQRAMSAKWLRSVGKYSYAIYVIDLPLSHLIRERVATTLASGSTAERLASHTVFIVGVFALSYVLARVSWIVIEQPFLNLKRFFPMPSHGPSTTRLETQPLSSKGQFVGI